MLRSDNQIKLSEYRGLYEKIIPKGNILRKIKENIDFSFVNPMLKESYCEHFGRPAKEPEMMFKLLFLKKLYDLSDEVLIQNSCVNMAYKYFLDLDPEEEMIDSSLLTKFRKTRITEDILEEMLKETIAQAIEKDLIKSTAIIVDATHTKARARAESPTEILRKMTKELRKEIYLECYELSVALPDKPVETSDLTEEIAYSKQLLENTEVGILQSGNPKLRKQYEKIKALLEEERIREIRSGMDNDARFGHKSETQTFFGYKTHIAMTEERLITGIEVTSGAAADGGVLKGLVEQSKENGIVVKEVIGDRAYSWEENITYCEDKGVKLISSLNPVISNTAVPKNDGFVFNKDACTMQCPAGHLAMRYEKHTGKYDNTVMTYCFSKKKCRICPQCISCKVGQSKTNTYSITIMRDKHREWLEFEKSEYFKRRMRNRYMIEAKNSELKNAHGMDRSDSVGLDAMRLQSYLTAFVVNVKRILKLNELVAG